MKIEYKNISNEEYYNISLKKRKEKSYCVEHSIGKIWIINGKRHREDGPAVECYDGTNYWCMNGRKYSFVEWCNKLNKSDEEKVFLSLKYGKN